MSDREYRSPALTAAIARDTSPAPDAPPSLAEACAKELATYIIEMRRAHAAATAPAPTNPNARKGSTLASLFEELGEPLPAPDRARDGATATVAGGDCYVCGEEDAVCTCAPPAREPLPATFNALVEKLGPLPTGCLATDEPAAPQSTAPKCPKCSRDDDDTGRDARNFAECPACDPEGNAAPGCAEGPADPAPCGRCGLAEGPGCCARALATRTGRFAPADPAMHARATEASIRADERTATTARIVAALKAEAARDKERHHVGWSYKEDAANFVASLADATGGEGARRG